MNMIELPKQTNTPGAVLLPTEPPKTININDYRVTLKSKFPPVRPSILIAEKWACTEGGILLISGQKKSGKSHVILKILATALMKECEPSEFLNVRSLYTEKKVIYIDTEQMGARTKGFIEKVIKSAGLKTQPDNLEFYNIRRLDVDEKHQFLINFFNQMENVGIIVIDGIADFVNDINDQKAAKDLGDLIFKHLPDEASLVTVIHEGKDKSGAMGHLGQQIEKKCSCTVSINKDRQTNTHSMRCTMIRDGGDFEEQKFHWSEQHGGFVLLSEELKQFLAKSAEDKKNEDLKALIIRVFVLQREYERAELIEKIIETDDTIKKTSKDDTKKRNARDRISNAIELGYLEINNDDKYISIIK
jgi:hypothetical protein